ncbi:Rv0361 family membrane protein [Mycolicibacterium parafortuitum]|uniref:DUF4878 domain-containing protein n=1 Tax=Mycolicibacterium parafortuitum TaxID=39692 RepID=A0A375YF99_MYCPF|nr:DUF4878 domain-containing protein [Mycolicibacterium parafortuitum]ORB31467.1 DUF4878 domain-containing protein [Mycolicibacterium parafortuitum]SRX79770.1 hypothetical protein [Nocardia brasiliensis ATCC 700358] [Mycolicibacterium parafortuitum]
MSNAEGPDDSDDTTAESSADAETEVLPGTDPEHEPATEVFAPAEPQGDEPDTEQSGERRFTAPSGFDAGSTQVINRPNDPATEAFTVRDPGNAPTEAFAAQKPVAPQMIPPRGDAPKAPKTARRNWGWVIAIIVVIAALAAVAVVGTILLTRGSASTVSQEDAVRSTIQNYDAAIEKGDLATLRSITCGTTAEGYNNIDDKKWADTHRRVAQAGRYPVVASIDQVVINGDHAEANVTTFMAYAPQTRSTRSFDLQFRDDQWKVCQAPSS